MKRSQMMRSRWAAVGAAVAVAVLGGGGVLVASAAGGAGEATAFVSTVPTRVLDTRNADSPIKTLGASSKATIPLGSYVPAEATSVALNVTVVNGTASSFLTVYPTGVTQPVASNLNWSDKEAHPNSVVVKLGTDHSIDVFNHAGKVDVVIDLSGYYVPAVQGSGQPGPKGETGPKGEKGDNAFGTFGPVHLAGREAHGCATDGYEVWAHTDADRYFVAEPAQDGTGYIVTRYDVNGTFESIPGAQHPGCADAVDFTSATTGTWNGVWTQKVTFDMDGFDYDPEAALPASGSWDDFLTGVFGLDDPSDVEFVSYEFDYYNECGDHWRDSNFGGNSIGDGTIEDCV